MTVSTEQDADGRRRLVVRGDLDATVAPGLLDQADVLVAGASQVLLDLRGAGFLDSGGLRLVDRLHRAASGAGASFAVVAPVGTQPRRLLELVGLADALVVRES